MKKLLLLASIFFSFPGIKAQNLNKAGHTGIDVTYSMISINSKSYYLERILPSCCYNQLNLVAINDSGKVLFRKNIAVSSADFFRRIIKTKENQILILGYYYTACDVGGGKDFITKLDTNGNVLFQVNIQNSFSSLGGEILDITQHTDSSFYLVSSTDLLHYSTTGQFISRVNTGLTAINTVFALNNGNLLINGVLNSQLKNLEFTTSLTIVNQQISPNPIVKFLQGISGNLFGKTSLNSIEKYNPNLVLTASSPGVINPTNIAIQDFAIRNDSVFVIGLVSSSLTPYYGLLGSNLALLYQTQATHKNVRPTGISVTNKNKITIITTGSSNINTNVTFTGLYQFGLNGTFQSDSDIGVESYVATSTYLFPYYTGPYVAYFPVASFNVVVRNFGTDTVKRFFLNEYQNTFQCISLFHKLYEITIAPGETVTVQTGTFQTHYSYIVLPTQQATATKIKYCFFTTIPNYSNDVSISNDSNCDSVSFLVTGLDENTLVNTNTKIFPNPFINTVRVTSDVTIRTIKTYSSIGVLLNEAIVEGKEWEIKNTNLADGIYFLKIETEKGTITKKVLKN